MKIFKSIKWRLQIWYGIILLVVLAGFGFTAYQMERGRLFGQIDQELHRRISVLGNALHRPPPRGENGNRPPPGQPPRGQEFNAPPLDDQPPERFSEDRPPAWQRNHLLPEFHLPAEDAHFFETNDPHSFYFIIRAQNEQDIGRSTNQPAGQFFEIENVLLKKFSGTSQGPEISRPPPLAYSFGNYQNIAERLPSGEVIWVGCSIVPELEELHRTALNLVAVGGLILLIGLAGGAWLVSRAMQPIGSISATAAKISAGDLSQRINVAETESELGQLAAVLNSTFARLETAFAQQKQFASDAAHELRTPVSVMLTQTQTALNRERDAASYRLTVEACQRAAQRMRRLTESLLVLARFDAGQEVLNRLRFDFSKTIGDSVDLVQPLAEERGVKISIAAEPLEITGDSERLAQVVTNLLTNAIQYNQPKGEVRVKLEAQNGLAVLTVADTGQGIAAENLPRVFGRFFRADQSRTGAGNAGLGLAICKAIVETHGGTIEVASEINSGTTFTVRLPKD